MNQTARERARLFRCPFSDMQGEIEVSGNVNDILIGGDLLTPGYIDIGGNLGSTDVDTDPCVQLVGSITGVPTSQPALLYVGGVLRHSIHILKSLDHVRTNGPEIVIDGVMNSNAAIVVDYDGADFVDYWDPNAIIEVNSNQYQENTAAARVYAVTHCLGDANNDGVVDNNDIDPFELAYYDQNQYAIDFPGLSGSRTYHIDCDRNGLYDPNADPIDNDDLVVFGDILAGSQCCIPDCANIAGGTTLEVDITDLSILLSNYGMTGGLTSRADGDIEPPAHFADHDVDISDLALMLSVYGHNCYDDHCGGGGTESFFGGEFDSEGVSVDIETVDTSEYSGGGFAGEDEHFVFDVLVTLSDSGDDWTTCATILSVENGATLRLAPDPNGLNNPPPTPGTGEPQEYTTFVSVPKSATSAGRFNAPFSVGGIAGAYEPVDLSYTFTDENVNLAWFDFEDDSNDGPAAVMRIVLDVSAVSGADTSGGLGSVYFSDSGPLDPSDILIADFEFAVTHTSGGATPTQLIGAFYVVQ